MAGYSSNGVNVVIWDTLAPPSTSRASILCHEGIFLNELNECSCVTYYLSHKLGRLGESICMVYNFYNISDIVLPQELFELAILI